MSSLILILGDQLNKNISSLENFDKKNDVILMCEVMDECLSVKHHKKKIAFILSSMRHFAQELVDDGFTLEYVKLDDEKNTQSFLSETKRICQKYQINNVKFAFPGEYRVLENLQNLEPDGIALSITQDNKFLCDIDEFKNFAQGKKSLLMENFYRYMRLKHNILMEDEKKPVGGKWNFDSENRKPPKSGLKIPQSFSLAPDKITQEVINLVEKKFPDHFGDIEPFYLATSRVVALEVLDKFIGEKLSNFGDFQDAMIEGEDFIYHSAISFYLNNGFLQPLEVIEKIVKEYDKGRVKINCVEGFIRQILGWREFVRGIYWLKMPQYKNSNFLEARNNLPSFFWDQKTKMNCVKESVRNTAQNAYAHHIQRLMILGNFALIAQIDPKQVSDWYLLVYADAYEWVELPNVWGMILFADGGFFASKPYAASGSYINKMSNYCKNCQYNVKEKTGDKACPFNYLYWNFLIKNKGKLQNNHRMRLIYKSLERFDDDKINDIKKSSEKFLNQIDILT